MSAKKTIKRREWTGWAGIVGDFIDTTTERYTHERIKSIYPSRRIAKRAYQSVIKVKIIEVKK